MAADRNDRRSPAFAGTGALSGPLRPKPLNWRLGLLLIGLWAALTVAVVALALPFWIAKAGLGACALAWAAHVLRRTR